MTTAEPQPTEEPHAAPPARVLTTERGGRAPLDPTAPAFAGVTAVLLLAGGALMRVPEASGFLGPRFFPLAVGTLLVITAVAAAAWGLRTRGPGGRAAQEAEDANTTESGVGEHTGEVATEKPRSDWRTLGMMAATLTAHIILLEPMGWLLAGTLLFWGTSYALDRGRPLMDLFIAAALAGVVQVVFSGLLGVTLPAGVVGKVL